MENVEYKFQILFVFGQSYMSKDAAKNLTKEWQLENKEHHDLIIAGMYCFALLSVQNDLATMLSTEKH